MGTARGARVQANVIRMLRRAPATPQRRPEMRPGTSSSPAWGRLFEAFDATPAWIVGAGVAFAFAAAFVALDLWDGNLDAVLDGRIPLWQHVEIRSALVVSALLAGVVAIQRYEELGMRSDLERLRSQLRGAGSRADFDAFAARPAPRLLDAAGATGALMITAIVPTLYLDPLRFTRLETYAMPSVIFDLAVGAVLGWTAFRALVAGIVQDRAFARLSRRVTRIDLLDLRPLHAFVRRSLRRTLRWLLLVSLAGLAFVDAGWVQPPATTLTALVGLAAYSFLQPVHAIHRRIREEKQTALERLRAEIRREWRRVEARGEGSDLPGGRLADLLAWEARIAAAPEWPLDTTTLLRFGLYLLLPIGSWLGGAFVERAVDLALD